MSKTLRTLVVLAFLAAFVPVGMAANEDVENYEKRVKELNSLGEKPGMKKVALQRISTETGVPLEQVQNQHQKNPEVGIAGLMIANVLAADTRKGPGEFLKERATGKRWLTMARENKVPVERLNSRLDRLERAIKGELK